MLTERLTRAGRATEILRELVRIESVNPFYPGGERGEVAMADYLAAFFRRLGLEPTRQEVLPGRENVWARLDAARPGADTPTLLLEAHMDTVTLQPAGSSMLEPRIQGGRMTGRGSCDTKASLAAMLTALESLVPRRRELAANLIVLGSVDEEYLMRGIVAFAGGGPKVDAAVVGEPTLLNVVRAHKGLVRWTIETRGRSAHTSRPEVGDNAIYQMVELIAALRPALEPRLSERGHRLLGRPTFTVSTIHGGLGVNIVPDQCAIAVDRRTLPAEPHDAVIAELHAVVGEITRDRPHLRVEIGEPFADIAGLDTPDEHPFVRLTTRVAQAHGGAPNAVGVPYGTNAPGLAAHGVPTVVLGPGDIAQAHSEDEWVELDQVERAAELYAQLGLDFRGAAARSG
ncbi:MAG TPA: M20 family metallopeptidase [Chloroflexota bacterium]|nr:M20 family metallopeptidase [Chloroflexota bacterium]